MKGKVRSLSQIALASTLCAIWVSSAPVSENDPLEQGYQEMYNLRFDDAHRTFRAYGHVNPEDPMAPVSDAAAYLFFELDRLKILHSEFFADNQSFFSRKKQQGEPQVKRDFEAALAESKKRSDATMQKDPASRDAMLSNVLRRALHANYVALIDKDNWQGLTEVKQARTDAEALVKKYPDCYDAFLAMGVENYLLSQKAAPLRVFLRLTGAQTDKEQGLADLRVVASKGHYLKPYAKILLAIAALRENHKAEAKQLLRELSVQFPRNDLFQEELKKLL